MLNNNMKLTFEGFESQGQKVCLRFIINPKSYNLQLSSFLTNQYGVLF